MNQNNNLYEREFYREICLEIGLWWIMSKPPLGVVSTSIWVFSESKASTGISVTQRTYPTLYGWTLFSSNRIYSHFNFHSINSYACSLRAIIYTLRCNYTFQSKAVVASFPLIQLLVQNLVSVLNSRISN